MNPESEAFKNSMRITIDYSNMMRDFIGCRGLTHFDMDDVMPQCIDAANAMSKKRSTLKWLDLPCNSHDIVNAILDCAARIRAGFDNFVVLGIGGSALGPIAVHQALSHLYYNELPDDKRHGPRFYVIDNIDPDRIKAITDIVDMEKTIFCVITKSGNTAETMAQFLYFSALLKNKLGMCWNKHLIAITDEHKGNLIKTARDEDIELFYVPDGVGGRFSELSPVGLLPAAVCGIDIVKMLEGAAYMEKLCRTDDIYSNPAYLNAALEIAAMRKGHNISVMMPYSDSLRYFADWYAQLWAESLGKRIDRNGNTVNCGQTPVKALGVTDQHSQLQLYTEGPYDKTITIIRVGAFSDNVKIPDAFKSMNDLSYLSGHTFNHLIDSECIATEYALKLSGHINKTIYMPTVNPFTIGELIMLFEIQTAFAGELLNIDAFDQPGVEAGKIAANALMGKPGGEALASELKYAASSKSRLIV